MRVHPTWLMFKPLPPASSFHGSIALTPQKKAQTWAVMGWTDATKERDLLLGRKVVEILIDVERDRVETGQTL